jgi:sulfonate transport system permease protein
LVSAGRALTGFVLGGVIGFLLGLVNGVSKTSERLLDTTVQMVRTIPILALMPLIILWFGIGEESKVVMVALGVFFPLYLNTFHGIRNIDQGLVEMARVYGFSPWERFIHVILPGALPSILVGLRFSLGIMWLVLIVAEMVAANSGIGYRAIQARELMQMDVVLVTIVVYALLGKGSDVAAQGLERWLLAWNPNMARPKEAFR